MKYDPTNDVEVVCAALLVPVVLAAGAKPPCPPMVALSVSVFVSEGIPDPSMVVAVGCEFSTDVAVRVDASESVVPGLAETRPDVGIDADTAADTLSIAADALTIANEALDSAAVALAYAADASMVAGDELGSMVVVVVVSDVTVVIDVLASTSG